MLQSRGCVSEQGRREKSYAPMFRASGFLLTWGDFERSVSCERSTPVAGMRWLFLMSEVALQRA